jgi:hypothetical protein
MVHFSRCVKSLVESGAPCFALQECISSWCWWTSWESAVLHYWGVLFVASYKYPR